MLLFKKRDELKVFDNVFEPVVVVDEIGKLIYFNYNFRVFSQSNPRVLKKAKLQDIVLSNGFNVDKFIRDGFELFKSILTEEVHLSFPDEISRVAVLKGESIEILGEKLFIIYFNDVSVERNLYEKYRDNIEELKSAYKQILQADKLTTMGELTASISHEIANPLTIARGNLEMLQYSLQDKSMDNLTRKENFQKGFKNVWNAIGRINDIILNMRNFLHSSEDKKEYCRLDDLLKNSVALVANFYQSGGVSLSIDLKRVDLVVLVNRVKMEQVFINLLKNAYDAIKNNKQKDGKVKIQVTIDREKDLISIDFIDNGPGVQDQHKVEIFNMFFTTKNMGEGTGLGLSICKRIIESLSGTLVLHSTRKGETIFRIQVPMIEASSYSYNETYAKRVSQIDGKKILVVDNEVEVLNVMNKFLQDSGYVFIGSTNGEEALDFLENIAVDLIISDVEMPLMDGIEFAKNVRERGIEVPLYYLSSMRNVNKFNENKESLQLSGFIIKPFGQQQIIDAIKHSIG